MRVVKILFIVILCVFVLNQCGVWNLFTSSEQETITESQEETMKKDKKSNKKKKPGKKEKSNNKKNKKKKPEISTNESKVIKRAKESINNQAYIHMTYTADITYEMVLDYYFDSTQWIEVNNDDFEGVEFIGILDGRMKNIEVHFYYDANRMEWEEEFDYFVDGEKDVEYEEENTHSELMFIFYMIYLDNNKIDVGE